MSYYLTDDNGGTLWRIDSGDDEPLALAYQRSTYPEVWQLLLRGAGLDPAYELVERSEYDELLTAADNFWGGGL